MQAAFGASYAAFGVAIPALKARAHLSNGQLSALLSLQALGGVVAMSATAPLYRAVGASIATLGTALALGVVMVLAAANTTFAGACVLFALLGPLTGAIKVFLDTAAIGLERPLRPVLGRTNATYSAGVLLGSAGAAVALQVYVTGSTVVAAAGLALGLAAGVTALWASGQAAPEARAVVDRVAVPIDAGLLLLCLAMGLANLTSGGILRWLNVYLTADLGAPGGSGGAALTACHLATLLGQLVGDRWAPRLPIARLAWAAGSASAVALGLGLAHNAPWSVAAGCAVAMLCLANVPTAVQREVGLRWLPAQRPTVASWVSGTRSAATLLGSPLIGGLSYLFGLRVGLLALSVSSAGSALFALPLRGALARLRSGEERVDSAPDV